MKSSLYRKPRRPLRNRPGRAIAARVYLHRSKLAVRRRTPKKRGFSPLPHPLIASLLFGIAEIELLHAKERQAIGIALTTGGRSIEFGACQRQAARAPQRRQGV